MTQLTDTAIRRIGYLIAAVSMTLAVAGLVIYLGIGQAAKLYEDWALHNILTTTAFGIVGLLALRTQPRNPAVWATIFVLVFGSLQAFGAAIGLAIEGFSNADIQANRVSVAPADINPFAALAFQTALWTWVPAQFTFLTVLILRAPNGELPAPVWRWVERAAILAMAVQTSPVIVQMGPWSETPYDVFLADGEEGVMGPALGVLALLAIVSLAGLIMRYRSSLGEERLQLRWIIWALGIVVLASLTLLVDTGLWRFLGLFVIVNGGVSFGVAITKYRLYEIDLVISRSLVFVLLVGFITAVYAGVVVGIGSLIGGSSVGWSIAATALVAVVFEPVRDRVQRWVNRLVYGQRATPYEVLSDLTSRLAATEREEGLLGRMAQRLAEGTGADRAVVWTKQGSEFTPAAYAPASEGALDPVPGLDVMPGSVVPIVHDNAVLGALSVESRRGDALTPTEQRLVEDLAGSAGLLMRRLRLDAELERKAEELEESRRRLVNAQDVERRRLERQLDEGAQQRVLGLKLQLGLAEQQARAEGAERAAALIGQMALGAQDAIDQIRALAHGIYPPLLESDGLHAALRALAEVAPVDVAVDVVVGRRYPLEVEGAVYFCVSEAVTNAVKHGEPPITVHVSDATGELVFTVADSGPGFDPTAVARGSGLDNMTDRLDALGGTFTIDTTPGSRTGLTGRLPLRPAEVSA
jgi:signal transduction histidine kinase